MAVGDAHVFPGFLTPVLIQISVQSHRLLFSHASAEVRGQNTPPETNFASTGSRTHNHQVMSPTRSPLSHSGEGAVKVALTLYHTTNFRLVQIESLCRRQNKCNLKTETFFEMGRKSSGKRRKCCLPIFSPIPTMFLECFFFRVVKSRDYVVRN